MNQQTLVFSSEHALLSALMSHLIPPAVQRRRVTYWIDDSGAIFVRPVRKLAKDVIERLRVAGVAVSQTAAQEIDDGDEMPVHHARIWPHMIAPVSDRRDVDVAGQTVLLYIPEDSARTLIDLAAELLRLGCDRCAYQMFARAHSKTDVGSLKQPTALLRVFDPPYYTIAAAGEPRAAYRSFVAVRSGDTRTWVEAGYTHPLAHAYVPPDDHIGLITGDGEWIDLPDGPWQDVLDIVDIQSLQGAQAYVPVRSPRRLQVKLRLTSATRVDAPSVWVLRTHQPDRRTSSDHSVDNSVDIEDGRESAIDAVDSLVATLPEDIIGRLLFTVVGTNEHPIVVLRARHGRTGPPHIDVPGVAMTPLFGITNLYVPHDAMLEPPLRRETVRDLLAPDEERIYWLAPVLGSSSRDSGPPYMTEREDDSGAFRVESAPERSFSPLVDWIDYLVHRSAEELEPWMRSVTFEFDSFQSIGVEWAAGPDSVIKSRASAHARTDNESTPPLKGTPGDRSQRSPEEPDFDPGSDNASSRESDDGDSERPPIIDPTRESSHSRIGLSDMEAKLAELERAFLDSDTPADAAERNHMWLSMAQVLVRLERHRDAAECFVRAAWELPVTEAEPILEQWARAERERVDIVEPTDVLWLPLRTDSPPLALASSGELSDWTRAIAAHWIIANLSGQRVSTHAVAIDQTVPSMNDDVLSTPGVALQRVQSWFDQHERTLSVRTSWLLRTALAQMTGGDPLALARARDQILQNLRTGLSLERDVPTFLRFLDNPSGGDSVAATRLVEGLESLVGLLDRVPRERKPTEAPIELTRSYVWLVIAYGLARLGQSQRAMELREDAAQKLDLNDSVHAYLYQVYTTRIDQALQGLPPETPLPQALSRRLNELIDGEAAQQLSRYRVDRLREVSAILEPHERVHAISGYTSRILHGEDRELIALHDLAPQALADEVERLMAVATAANTVPAERARLFDGLMDFFPLLPSARAVPALRIIANALDGLDNKRRLELLEEALMLAGHFGRKSLAIDIATSIATLVTESSTAEVESMALLLGACLRDLGRVGLRDDMAHLRDALSTKLGGENVKELGARVHSLAAAHKRKLQKSTLDPLQAAISALEARLHVAASLARLGQSEQAAPILQTAQQVLSKTSFYVVDHTLQVSRALAQALSECPRDEALAGLQQLSSVLAKITDNYNTNTHFCLSVIAFMECLVLGYAKSDLALGEFGRRFLDEDEYLVRRRIHREIGETS